MGILKTVKMYAKRTERMDEPTDIYENKVGLLEGGELDLSSHRGRPTLIVNTASKCGFTPQFEGLQKLYETYHEKGLEIIGCPSGDFAEQEFEAGDEIGSFCQRNYGVSFTMTEKMSVRAEPAPLWDDLARQPGSGPPQWNFSKYLVGPDGRLIKHWSTMTKPDDPEIVAEIEAALSRS